MPDNVSNPADKVQGFDETVAIDAADKTPVGIPPPSTKIGGGLDKLKKEHPEIYKQMMEAMASDMINKMKRAQDNLKKIMRESQQQ